MSNESLIFDLLAKDGVSHVLDKIGKKLDGLHGSFGKMAKVGGEALIGVATTAVGAGVATLKMAADFQEGMTSLVTGAGESEKNMRLVSDGILNMAGAVGESTKQLTAGMYMVESAGYHGAAGLNVLKVSAEGAKVGATDLGVMANAVTSALNAYHQPASKAAAITNTLIATVANGKMHMDELASSLGAVLPAASAAHLSLAQVGGAMATMTAQGTPAADAATYLRQTILNLMNPTSKARNEMKSLGLNFLDVAKNLGTRGLTGTFDILTNAITRKMGPAGTVLIETLKKAAAHTKTFHAAIKALPPTQQTFVAALASMVGGTKSMQAALELTGGNAAKFKGNVDAITKAVAAGGGKVQGWSLVQKDFNTQMAQAKETVSALGIRIGEKLLPTGQKMLSWLLNLITQLTDGKKHTAGFAGFIETKLVPAAKLFAHWVKDELVPKLLDLWHWFQDKGIPAAKEFAKWFETKVIPVLQKIVKDVLPAAKKMFEDVAAAIQRNKPQLEQLWGWFKHLADLIVTKVYPILGPLLKLVFKDIGFQITATIDFIGLFIRAATAMRDVMVRVLKHIGGVFLGFVQIMVDGAAKAFGWVPGLGPKLRAAAKEFDKFAAGVRKNILSDIPSGRTITVTAFGRIDLGGGKHTNVPLGAAMGGPVPAVPGSIPGRDSVPAMLMPGEFVIRSDGGNLADAMRHYRMPGFAEGGIVGKVVNQIGSFPAQFDKALIAYFQKISKQLVGLFGGAGIGGPVSGGGAHWAGMVTQILAMMGQPLSLLAGVIRRINFESGGNPTAINRTDSNARAGHPSQGLMQTIPGTFNAYAGAYRGRGITDPFANIWAGLHYALARYGSIAAIDPLVRPRGYDHGGMLPTGLSLAYNGTGRPEPVGHGTGGIHITNLTVVANDARQLVRQLNQLARDNGGKIGLIPGAV